MLNINMETGKVWLGALVGMNIFLGIGIFLERLLVNSVNQEKVKPIKRFMGIGRMKKP